MKAAAERKPAEPIALVVFGLDDAGKAHGSSFSAADADLAEKAAALMGMHVLRPETDEQHTLAARLPKGRVFASGRAFVPFVKMGLYGALSAAAGISARVPAASAESAPTASLGPPEGTSASGDPDGASGNPKSGGDGPQPFAEPPAGPSWAAIGVDIVVLAPVAPMEGWWEAVVVKVKDDVLTLKWRDFPEAAPFVRRRHNLALLHPTKTK